MKMIKKVLICMLVPVLLLSCPFVAFADDMGPDDYIFAMVLRGCGVSIEYWVDAFRSAYEGYLESVGNQALLNQLHRYQDLSWGETATGIDNLFYSVKEWLSLSDSYGTDSIFYNLPSKPSPQPAKVFSPDIKSLLTTPFSDPNPIPDTGYHYLFSDVYSGYRSLNKRLYYSQRNVYAPDGKEIFGVNTGYARYKDDMRIQFIVRDTSSSKGYSFIDLKGMSVQRYTDDDVMYYKGTGSVAVNYIGTNIRSVMNLPFKVFISTDCAEKYFKTGDMNYIFSKDVCPLELGIRQEGKVPYVIQRSQVKSVGTSMVLPPDLSEALSCVNNLPYCSDFSELTSILSAGGLEVDYHIPYRVEHYIQTGIRPGGEKVWEKKDTDEREGYYLDPASYEEKVYDLYSFSPDLTENGDSTIPADGNLVVKLYYEQKPPSVIAADSVGDVASAAGKGIISAFLKSFHWIFLVIFTIYLIKLIKSILKLIFCSDRSSADDPPRH